MSAYLAVILRGTVTWIARSLECSDGRFRSVVVRVSPEMPPAVVTTPGALADQLAVGDEIEAAGPASICLTKLGSLPDIMVHVRGDLGEIVPCPRVQEAPVCDGSFLM
ncbi:MAG: hypothetical protein AAGA21_16350 [Pseudomonadota bacterium]